MIPRYTPPAIAEIFSEESRLSRWLAVELRAAEAWAEIGRVPHAALAALRTARIDAARIAELEAEQGHDVAAFVTQVQESIGPEGRWIHLGLTSSDIVDTALATMLRDAAAVVDSDCGELEAALVRQAERHRLTVMPGRTHGVHAEPLTLGIKLANHLDEIRRCRTRLAAATAEVAVGQLSGAVGTHALVPPAVEESVCAALGLSVAPVATQVVARDRHAAFVCALALLGSVLERLATTVRLSQITEVDELGEPFSTKQKGSSAMPHKRNPILCERLCGLARVLRGYAATAMEDVPLWHERDISHSSAERVILPDALALTCYMTRLATRVVDGLRVNRDAMQRNVFRLGGIAFSQRVLTALIDSGWSREDAYRTVQALAARARADSGDFRALVSADSRVAAVLAPAVLDDCFDIAGYLTHIDDTYARIGLRTDIAAAGDDETESTALAAEAGLGGGT